MPIETIKEIYDQPRQRRVVIFRHETGTFGYELEYYSAEPRELCWCPNRSGSHGIYDSAERAESEARDKVKWLKF